MSASQDVCPACHHGLKTLSGPLQQTKSILKDHSPQLDCAMGRQRGVLLLHRSSALVLKEQHLNKSQSSRQDHVFLPQTSLQATQKSKGSLLPNMRSNRFEEQCSLSAGSLATDAGLTNESFLLSFFSSSSCFSTKCVEKGTCLENVSWITAAPAASCLPSGSGIK